MPAGMVESVVDQKFTASEISPINSWSILSQTDHSKNTINPVRRIVENCTVTPNPEKSVIKFHLGDPTVGGELPPSPVAIQAIKDSVTSLSSNGYFPATGSPVARQAIVDRFSTETAPFTSDDVILTSGCSHALQISIEAIANKGDNILVPSPGFPHYSTLCRSSQVIDKAYLVEINGEDMHINLPYLESIIDDNTKAIIINNPGNPSGGVFTKEHLEEILEVAEKFKLIIIADEIYGDIVFNGAIFYPIASLTPKVPVITCDGLAKRWMVPGWRLGWIIVHNRFGVLSDVKKGIVNLTQKIVGACSLVQGALPKILMETPEEYFEHSRNLIKTNADIVIKILQDVSGVTVIKPKGAMYMMLRISGCDANFCQELVREESVFCLPGQVFAAPGYIRIVLTLNKEVMEQAANRIREFCLRKNGN